MFTLKGNEKRHIRKVLFCIGLFFLFLLPIHAENQTNEMDTARPSINGRLHVEGTKLVDEKGEAVQLRGVSTHGLTWYRDFINPSLFNQVSIDWNANLMRLAMYSELYCGEEKDECMRLMKEGIDYAIASDMYVLVDWHILEDYDPNMHIEEAKAFFKEIATLYQDVPNLIFEICNEPNGETDWADVVEYSNEVIPIIREIIPESVIVVGTPEYDRNLGSAMLRPLSFDNVMYVLHFYAASHHEGLMGELQSAIDAGLPVFISECGICESTGDGAIDFASAAKWFTYLNENKIGYAVWSLSNKNESSAFFKQSYHPSQKIQEKDLTESGKWVREVIRGKNPKDIPVKDAIVEKNKWDEASSRISDSLGERGYTTIYTWPFFLLISLVLSFMALIFKQINIFKNKNKIHNYYDFINGTKAGNHIAFGRRVVLFFSIIFTCIYLLWRIHYSIPVRFGAFAVIANIALLIVEGFGFLESLILFKSLFDLQEAPLPIIEEDAYPEVDIFIATYNETTELLRKTILGCINMKYPDPSKVHIWLCDDNRRNEMKVLAKEMGVGYFDRPDHEGAKAGNLNHAMSLTSAPYIVTFDSDMIPKSDFLLKTIPYFVDMEKRNAQLPEEKRKYLGFLQTPQAFYTPDLFQHALYSEKRAPNEQDFFYRTIEPSKTSTNSVIYGGSNTVLMRQALEDVGGFFTGSITEDFATGLLIESKGYLSLALPEPLASGQAPDEYTDYIKQRTRWGRGVIATARKLKIWTRKGLTFMQRLSYWSSVTYWYSPIKNLIYILSPLLFATFAVPVFECNWLELFVFWLPMFLFQEISLIVNSRHTISQKWTGIYETCVMPHLLWPILQETVGISFSSFVVTNKNQGQRERAKNTNLKIPFYILIGLSLVGILRIVTYYQSIKSFGLLVVLFWIIRNLYYLVLSIFLIDGRDTDGEVVHVIDAVPITVKNEMNQVYEGVTTHLTEHHLTVYLDDSESLKLGDRINITLQTEDYEAHLFGVVTQINRAKRSDMRIHGIEILEYGNDYDPFISILYDRIPTLPQSLNKDFGIIRHLWQNIAHRMARTRL